MNSYRELKVWDLGMEIALAVYGLTAKFPDSEKYGLTNQLRRCSCSIPSNIAEGHARGATKDMLRFLGIARGSLAELETQLLLARRLGFVAEAETDKILRMADEESRMLSGLRKSVESKL